jgi:hypothetical protein
MLSWVLFHVNLGQLESNDHDAGKRAASFLVGLLTQGGQEQGFEFD